MNRQILSRAVLVTAVTGLCSLSMACQGEVDGPSGTSTTSVNPTCQPKVEGPETCPAEVPSLEGACDDAHDAECTYTLAGCTYTFACRNVVLDPEDAFDCYEGWRWTAPLGSGLDSCDGCADGCGPCVPCEEAQPGDPCTLRGTRCTPPLSGGGNCGDEHVCSPDGVWELRDTAFCCP